MPIVADGGSPPNAPAAPALAAIPSLHAPAASGSGAPAPPATPAASSAAAAPAPATPAPARRQQVQRISRQGPLSLFSATFPFEDNDIFENLMATDPLVTNLLSQFINPITRPPSNFMAPVVVRPTAAQIEAASELTTLQGETLDDVCTICQDGYTVNASVRRLNACGHRFHQACIDQWFASNVRCPVCRHDIRDTANQNANQPTNQPANQNTQNLVDSDEE